MTTKTTPPTEDEVLTALLRETTSSTDIGGGKTLHNWSPASKTDVAERIARMRGWNGTEGWETTAAGYTPSRGTVIAKRISIKAVQEVLDRLYGEDRVHAFYGHHRVVAGQYGVDPRVTYYLSQEALDLMLTQKREWWVKSQREAALEAAQQRVLREHAPEVAEYEQETLAKLLAAEPDWQAILNDDQENGQ